MKTVVQVAPTDDFKVYVYFDDGKIKLFNMSHLIGVGVFAPLSDLKTFKEKCTILNDTLAWDLKGNRDEFNCLDIDPLTIYNDGQDVTDPLAR
jgi:hypothetical protein